jgi:hypothetical protein
LLWLVAAVFVVELAVLGELLQHSVSDLAASRQQVTTSLGDLNVPTSRALDGLGLGHIGH